MIVSLVLWLCACSGKDERADSAGAGSGSGDDSGTDAHDDSGKTDDSAPPDDSVPPDDSSPPDDTGCTPVDWYADGDVDGYGAGVATSACESPGKGWVTTDGDCNDTDVAVSPDATELCNSFDDDCDELVDTDDPTLVETSWYPDLDADGHGDPSGTAVVGCESVSGHAPNGDDCNDADATTYPGAPERCDDVQQDCATKAFAGDVGVATFYPASGGYTDMTATMAAGVYGKPALVPVPDDGELVICDGTWYAEIEVKALSAQITGLHGSAVTIVSGGDARRTLGVTTTGATVKATGLTFTEGNGCFGAAVSNMAVSMCGPGGAGAGWTTDTFLTLDDVRVEGNAPIYSAFSAVYWNTGTLVLVDTTIDSNTVEGLETTDSFVTCTGSPKNDAGIWGNTLNVFFQSSGGLIGTSGPYSFTSDGCDFDGASPATADVSLTDWLSGSGGDYDYGDDATFACDTESMTCL